MKKFIIEDSVLEILPEIQVGTILCTGVNNRYQGDEAEYLRLIRDAEERAADYLKRPDFSENPVIKVWREAFQKFKTKKGARCSIEALMKRIEKGNPVGTINPLVDIYNATSLTFALPAGGEDVNKIEGDVRLAQASGDEPFLVLGSEESSSPYPEEIVYKDDAGALCRCLNWREAVRTMLTEDTTSAFLCMESIDPARSGDLLAALNELKEQVEGRLGGVCTIQIANREHPVLEWGE